MVTEEKPSSLKTTTNKEDEIIKEAGSESVHEANSQPAPEKQQSQNESQQNQNKPQGQNFRRNYRDRRWNNDRDRDLLYEKAVRLAKSGRVEFLNSGVYNVVGNHGTYIVAMDYTGKLSCNCMGFIQKGKCSHVMAVSLLTKNRRRR
ncbi:MAG: hypothetical protein GX638_08385 [Crenarchaeota archaeon]|nr:hypothetical protein [Thermoproteota archaeon]